MRAARRNQRAPVRLILKSDFGGDMSTTEKSILERIAARMKEIVAIAEAAATRAMETEKPPQPRSEKRVPDLMER